MWLIVGLGNPGKKYADTRHNLGFLVADALSRRLSIPFNHKTKHYSYGRSSSGDRDIILIKPATFMNNSGVAVRDALRKYGSESRLVVIHDDLDVETGIVKIKKNGSSGGHRGIESIIESTGSRDFIRVKVGIGRPEEAAAEEYVLRPFKERERPLIRESLVKAAEAVEMILEKGVAHAQHRMHTR